MQKKARLQSYDVFDTVLTRRLIPPSAAWFELADTIIKAGLTNAARSSVAHLRSQAELLARELPHTCSEPTLEEIAQIFAQLLDLPTAAESVLIEQELAIERHLLVAVPGMADRLHRMRVSGCRIVFISATYLSSTFVREELLRRELAIYDERVIVSCEARASKADGRLYAHAIKQLNLPGGASLHHTGDDPTADVVAPRQLGIGTTHLTAASPTQFEHTLARNRRITRQWGARISGAARLERLRICDEQPSSGPVSVGIATGVTAPAVISFVAWILTVCRKQGIRRLNFMARDGQLLMHVANTLQAGEPDPIELNYLLVSRRSTFPIVPEEARSAAKRLVRSTRQASGPEIAEWFGIDTTSSTSLEVKNSSSIDRPLAPKERLAWLDWLDGPEFFTATTAAREERRKLLQDYLRQEGLVEGDRAQALVDLGWRGSLAKTVDDLTRAAGGRKLATLFFGLDAQALKLSPGSSEAFMFDGRSDEPTPFTGLPELLEVLCKADHPQVVGYDRAPDSSVHVRLSPHLLDNNIAGTSVEDFQAMVTAVAKRVVNDFGSLGTDWELASMTEQVLGQLWEDPSPAVARSFGATLFATNPFDSDLRPIAEPYRLRDVLLAMRSPLDLERSRYWRRGSEELTNRSINIGIASALRLRRFAKRVLRPVRGS